MKINSFQDLDVWKKAKELTIFVYRIFEHSHDFAFRDQIQRAAISIMNNVAEGFDRRSDKQFKYLLFIARGSCAEVRSMIILAKELERISEKDYQAVFELSKDVSCMLINFIKYLSR